MWDVGEYKVVFSITPDSKAGGKSICIGDNMCIIAGWKDGNFLFEKQKKDL